jgi:hypothetical protein
MSRKRRAACAALKAGSLEQLIAALSLARFGSARCWAHVSIAPVSWKPRRTGTYDWKLLFILETWPGRQQRRTII